MDREERADAVPGAVGVIQPRRPQEDPALALVRPLAAVQRVQRLVNTAQK